jgi:hypothetical protein
MYELILTQSYPYYKSVNFYVFIIDWLFPSQTSDNHGFVILLCHMCVCLSLPLHLLSVVYDYEKTCQWYIAKTPHIKVNRKSF